MDKPEKENNPFRVLNSERVKIKKNILIAPLNWGLGHAARCIPIIKNLQQQGFNPIIASDGQALELLKKEFPHLTSLELPSYNIQYSKKGKHLKWKFLQNSPNMIFAVWKEKRIVDKWIEQYNVSGIISDNRFGIYSKKVPSVYITHQINVLSGNTTWFSSKIHQSVIKKYDECWIPDIDTYPNLSGKLGNINGNFNIKLELSLRLKYIGILSRFKKEILPIKYNLMVLLSGPEPQRTILENRLISELKHYPKNVLFIKGIVESEQKAEQKGNITFYNFMQSQELEKALNESELILCRSGYSTIMDLAKLNKKAFFIPTPGQFEQEYLAEKLQRENLVPFSCQDSFIISDLKKAKKFKGFSNVPDDPNWNSLFNIFQ